MIWPLYPWGKSPQYPLNRRLGAPQSQFGCVGEVINLLRLPGFKPQIIQPIAKSLYQICYIVYTILPPFEVYLSLINFTYFTTDFQNCLLTLNYAV
jgi:hypothetical protein